MHVFSPYLITIMRRRVHKKIESYRKFVTAVRQYKVSSNVAEDLRIVFLQSNLIWQLSCSGLHIKAHTEINSWSIYDIKC